MSNRAHGVARSSYGIEPGRVVSADGDALESGLVDVEANEDGGIRFLSGRASDVRNGAKTSNRATTTGPGGLLR